MATTLGVPTLSYLPWAILCYTGVIFAIIWGFTGFGIAKIKPVTITMRNMDLWRDWETIFRQWWERSLL